MSTDETTSGFEVPWSGTSEEPAGRRKVAWGNGSGYDETSAPKPRVDAPAPAPVFGDTFPTVELAGDEDAGPTAWLHAGADVAPGWSTPAEYPSAPTEFTGAPDGLRSGEAGTAAGDLSSVFDDAFPEPSATGVATVETTAGIHGPEHVGWAPSPEPYAPPAPEPVAYEGFVFNPTVEAPQTPSFPDSSLTPAYGTDTADTADAGERAAFAQDAAARPYPLPASSEHVAAEPVTEPATFATPEPTSATVEPAGAAGGFDLGDLFDEEGDTGSQSWAAPSVAALEQTAADEAPPAPGPGTGSDTEPAAPSEAPVSPRSLPQEAAPAARRFDLAARRAAQEAAQQVTRAEVAAVSEDLAYLRYTHSEQLYNVVDRILGLGRGGDPELQAMIRNLVLTRNHTLDRQQRAAYQAMLEPRLASSGIQIANAADRDAIFDIAYDELLGIGPLGPLWRDDSIDEIMVSGPDNITVERRGRLELTPVRFRSQLHLEQTGRTLAGASGDDRAVSSSSPLVTIQLDRARVQFVWKPLAVAGVAMTIRKFGDLMDLGQLLSFGSLSEEMAAFLQDAVASKATLLVSGGTGSGKTTFINAVSEFIPDNERVVTIEDALELQLRNTHVERFVTKEAASADDTMLFGQDELLKASLRMRPDRIIVGEVRDGKAASVMLEAANTGHDGTMTTIHANGPELALGRLAMLLRRVEAMPDDVARAEVAGAINVVVQVVRKNRRRFVSHISVVEQTTGNAAGHGHGFDVTDIFTGDFPANAPAPIFRRVAGLRPDTELAIKMTDAGIDPALWE